MTVRQEGYTADQLAMASEATDLPTTIHVPQTHRPILASGDGVAAVGRDADAPHRSSVFAEPAQLTAADEVPQPDTVIHAGRHGAATIGDESHTRYPGEVALAGAENS